MSSTSPRRVVLAAVGSELRGDDAAGPAVLARVGALDGVDLLGALASPLDLLGAWDGADLAIVVDAVDGLDPPGGVCVIDVDMASAPDVSGRTRPTASSHGLGVIDTLRIARAMGTAPDRVLLVGVSSGDFEGSAGLSPAVSRAVERAAQRVVELAGGATAPREHRCPPGASGKPDRLGPARAGSFQRDHRHEPAGSG